ncbi:MAG: hypothetical protein HXO18_05975 [Prevotella shahii]|uniref:hypothetical protein n=1 Tax=Hoylesella shahii TaxID=228603 RepID=UPI001CAC2FAD|nr:hypothetical protein [Hoylesella shahii]MBF1568609.1 hypothetical protein [Hoylesella shahii]MBF1576238.1 hypothetical protein [Hoylesella shahii]MBF1589803.1 hypothetical protein [Hoylesella shahii]
MHIGEWAVLLATSTWISVSYYLSPICKGVRTSMLRIAYSRTTACQMMNYICRLMNAMPLMRYLFSFIRQQ